MGAREWVRELGCTPTMSPRDPVAEPSLPWTPLQLGAFRFAFAYVLLYYPVLPIRLLPGSSWLEGLFNDAWSHVVPEVAKNLFGITRGFPDTSDGLIDVRYSYARVACVALFAGLASSAWWLVERRSSPPRTHYRALHEALRVLLRYSLANAMLFYGLAKVSNHQFAHPSLELLLEPYGEQSRRGVLWNFMGCSTAYTAFGGAAECLGGVLVLFRRTTTLGALVIAGVMTNVVALNFSYDVPVKLYSLHLLAMSLFLLAPDLRRLADVLLPARATVPATLAPHFREPRARRGGAIAKAVFVAYMTLGVFSRQWHEWKTDGDAAPRPELYGIWDVTSFSSDGASALRPWRRLVIDGSSAGQSHASMTLWRRGESHERLSARTDAATHRLALEPSEGPPVSFSYARPDGDDLVLEGTLPDGAVKVTLRRLDEQTMRLLAGHFRWSVGDHLFGG
jgi:hypothetical protein